MAEHDLDPFIIAGVLGASPHNLAEEKGVDSDLSEVMIQRLFKLLDDIGNNRLKFTQQIKEPYHFDNQFIYGHMIDGFELIQRDDESRIVSIGSTKLCSFSPQMGG